MDPIMLPTFIAILSIYYAVYVYKISKKDRPHNPFKYDPVLISILRKYYSSLMVHSFMGVQPMTGPTGNIFTMKSNYSPKKTP